MYAYMCKLRWLDFSFAWRALAARVTGSTFGRPESEWTLYTNGQPPKVSLSCALEALNLKMRWHGHRCQTLSPELPPLGNLARHTGSGLATRPRTSATFAKQLLLALYSQSELGMDVDMGFGDLVISNYSVDIYINIIYIHILW